MDLVLLPGMNCAPSLWSGVVDRLELRGVTVHAPQLDGASVDEAVGLLLDRFPGRFALAGLSLGAIVAMALVRIAPERVERLALLDTNASGPTDAQRDGWTATLARLDAGGTAREIQQSLLPVLLSPSRSQAAVTATLEMADEVGDARLRDQLRLQLTRIDERPTLGAVAVPTCVLTGADDALCPRERHEEIVSRVPGARLHVVAGAGHLSTLERPAPVAEILQEWLGA